MNALTIELRKEKRTGVIPVLLAVGVLGAAYAFLNFMIRKDTLLNLPPGTDGCSADPALRHDYGSEYVRHYRRRLHDLQHGV